MGSGDNDIGTRVRNARGRLGWNRETLAFHSGISWSAIAQVESGRRRNLRPATLLALARALGVTIDYLVAGGGAPPPMLTHCALLYETDSQFLDAAVPFLSEGVERRESVLAVTTQPNVELLRNRLDAAAGAVEFADRSSWYRTPMAALASYRAFLHERVESGAPWVRILGEPLWNSGSDSELRSWVSYEAMLNLAFAAEPVSVMCPYDKRTVDGEICKQALSTHPQTAESDGLATSPDYSDPLSFVLEG
jgi:transcriptional regulator with XRE-family HTH domain